jgi:hypothetical protein
MKLIFSVSIIALGVATGAFAQTGNSASPLVTLAASTSILAPDWTLPSPCNSGAMVALASSSGGLVSAGLPNAEGHADANQVDYKCAGNARSGKPDMPVATPSRGKSDGR